MYRDDSDEAYDRHAFCGVLLSTSHYTNNQISQTITDIQ